MNPNDAALSDAPENGTTQARAPARKTFWVWTGSTVAIALFIGVAWFAAHSLMAGHPSESDSTSHADESGSDVGEIPVKTQKPQTKTLVRSVELPGTIRPMAQAELYAKVPGYLKCIQRDPTAHQAGAEVLDFLTVVPGTAPWVALVKHTNGIGPAQIGWLNAPQKDIGSTVRAGELLLEIDAPELWQDVSQKEAQLQQAEAELEQANANVLTAQAQIRTTEALKIQVETDVRKSVSDFEYRKKQYERNSKVANDRLIAQEIVDEMRNQMNAAQAAWESSQAKVKAVQAELAVVSSKFTAAKADVLIKEARVRIAQQDVARARILAEYSHVHAPFDGVITARSIDEGDFIQNSSSGQSRTLMTIANVDRVLVVINVPERDAPLVELGTVADLRMDARPGAVLRGYVTRIGPTLDPLTRTRRVEIELDNHDRSMLPGMYGHVDLTLQRIENAQAIPATAVYSRGGENYILEVTDGVARRRKIRIRFDDGKELEVVKLEGNKEVPLTGTEELIVSNKGEIADGQRVRTGRSTKR